MTLAGSIGMKPPQNMKPPRKALFIGRFQPFHKGHERLLRYLSHRYARVVITIGSSQEKRTENNPFSAQERRKVIKKVVAGFPARLRAKVSFAALPDQATNSAWVCRLYARWPPAEFAIASANPLVRRLLQKAGYALDASPLFRRREWEGAKIRTRIRRKEEASARLPPAIGAWMDQKGKQIVLRSSGARRGGGKAGRSGRT